MFSKQVFYEVSRIVEDFLRWGGDGVVASVGVEDSSGGMSEGSGFWGCGELCDCGVVGCCGCGYSPPAQYSDAVSELSEHLSLGSANADNVGSVMSDVGSGGVSGLDEADGLATRFGLLAYAFSYFGFWQLEYCDYNGGNMLALLHVSTDYTYDSTYGSVKNYFEKVLALSLEKFFERICRFSPFSRLRAILSGYIEESALQVAAIAGDALLAMRIRRENRNSAIGDISRALSRDGSRNEQCKLLQKIFWTATGKKVEVPRAYGSKLYEAMIFLSADCSFNSYFGYEMSGDFVDLSNMSDSLILLLRHEHKTDFNKVIKAIDLAMYLQLIGGDLFVGFPFFLEGEKVSIGKEEYAKIIGYSIDLLKYLCVVVAIGCGYDLDDYLRKTAKLTSTIFLDSAFDIGILKDKNVKSSRDYWLLLLLFLYENGFNRTIIKIISGLLNNADIAVTSRNDRVGDIIERTVELIDGDWSNVEKWVY